MVFGVEQQHADLSWRDVEVLRKHGKVEQHLHIVFLDVHPIAAAAIALDIDVSARLLLHQQLHVGCDEVGSSLNSELFANEPRFEHGFVALVLAEKFGDAGLYVAALRSGFRLECHRLEVGVGTVVECIFPEARAQCFGERCIGLVYDVVEHPTSEITHQDMLVRSTWGQSLELVEQVVMAILFETCGKRTDVEKEVGLYDNQSGNKRSSPLPLG